MNNSQETKYFKKLPALAYLKRLRSRRFDLLNVEMFIIF